MPRTVFDLEGQSFGELIVIQSLTRPEKERLYGKKKYRKDSIHLCRCSCGNEVYVSRSHLIQGSTISCGCKNKRNINKNKFGVGKKIYDWVLKEMIVENEKVYYICECKCGVRAKRLATELENGKSRRCIKCSGVNTGNIRRRRGCFHDITQTIMGRIKSSAKSRKLKFDLDIEELWELYTKQDKKCSLSGVPITFGDGIHSKTITASLDRIDSSKGYIRGNVQWVHKDINYMKQSFSQSKFLEYCSLIVENRRLPC